MTVAPRAHSLCVILAMLGSSAACSSVDGSDESRVLVLAAASLTNAFTEMEVAFEAAHDDIDIELSFSASSAVVIQVEEGAPAGVVALANESLMDELVGQDLASTPTVFATNSLTIAVPTGNPGNVASIADFDNGALLLGACAAQVPCGSYAADVFTLAGVEPALDTEAPDVRTLAAQVASGELDAALVYATDVAVQSDAITAVSLPAAIDVSARYPIAVVDDRANSQLFVDFVTSDQGRRILVAAGFESP